MIKEIKVKHKDSKYMWSDRAYTNWCKEQARILRKEGVKVDTIGITRLIHKRILIPNNIDLSKLIIKKKFKIKKNVK